MGVCSCALCIGGIAMNRLDKLLHLAKTNARYTHTLICKIIPITENGYTFNGYSLCIRLYKQQRVIDCSDHNYSNKEQCDDHITEFCKARGLTDKNTLMLIINISAASAADSEVE